MSENPQENPHKGITLPICPIPWRYNVYFAGVRDQLFSEAELEAVHLKLLCVYKRITRAASLKMEIPRFLLQRLAQPNWEGAWPLASLGSTIADADIGHLGRHFQKHEVAEKNKK